MSDKAYVVVPFARSGIMLGARQIILCDAPAKARHLAEQLAPSVAGVAVLERALDPETGDDRDTVIAEFGAVPPAFPSGLGWTVRLH